MEKLKQRQQQILDFIQSFIAKNGYAPTVREIANGNYYASTSNVHSHLSKLRDGGFISWTPGSTRTIKVLNSGGNEEIQPNGEGPR